MATAEPWQLEAARGLLKQGDLAQAEKAFLGVLAADAKSEPALLGLAALYTKSGRKKEAIEKCERIADLYVENGRQTKAVEIYARILKLDPNRPQAHAKIGDLLLKLGRPQEAMIAFRKAASVWRERNLGDDVDTLRRLLEVSPENERTSHRIELADALAKQGKTAQALVELREESRLLEALAELEIMGNRGNTRGGGNAQKNLVKVLQRVTSLDGNDLESYVKLARFLLASAPAKALSALQAALRLDRTNVPALKLLDNAFLALGQTDKALLAFDQLRKVQPAYGERTKRDSALGRIEGELELIDEFLSKELPHKAMDVARALVAKHPDSYDARLELKELYLKTSDPEGAITELCVVVLQALEQAELPFARAVLQDAMRLNPTHPRVREACVRMAERMFLAEPPV